MNKLKIFSISITLILLLSLAGQSFDVFARSPAAATDPGLGTAANASILSTALLTNSGTSSTSGDVDVSPYSQVKPEGLTVGGAFHSDTDGVAAAALTDAKEADLNIEGQLSTSSLGALDSLTLVSGVYDMGEGRLNGGILTLDGPGIYIFRASSDFISSGSIAFINGADPCNLYWHVETLATINGSSFAGTIIAGTGVHFGDSVTLNGRALAINGDVTLINNTITTPICAAAPVVEVTEVVEVAEVTATLLPAVAGLPPTGGAPIQNEAFPWGMMIVGGFSIMVLSLGVRALRRTHMVK